MKRIVSTLLAASMIFGPMTQSAMSQEFLFRHGTNAAVQTFQSPDEITIPGKVVEFENELLDPNVDPQVSLPVSVGEVTAGERITIPFEMTNANGIAMYGSLPRGLSINALEKTISGIATKSGTFEFRLRAFLTLPGHELKQADSNTLAITVLPILEVAEDLRIEGFVGSQLVGTVRTAGQAGDVVYTFDTPEGDRPSWLLLDSNGTLSGIALERGAWTVRVRATDSEGRTGVTDVSVKAIDSASLVFEDVYGLDNRVSTSISPVKTSGSWADFHVTQGSLPPGMAVNPNSGVIFGSPYLNGSYSFKIGGTLLGNFFESNQTTVKIAESVKITAPALPTGYQNDPYLVDTAVTASGGVPPYTFSMSGAQGIAVDGNSGIISGTPTFGTTGYPGAKPAKTNISVVDADGRTDFVERSLGVITEIAFKQLPALKYRPMVGREFSHEQAGQSQYGLGSATWSVENGPSWLSMSGGTYNGIPTTAGDYTFDVVVTDTSGNSAKSTQSFTVDPELIITEPEFGTTLQGNPINVSVQPTISGGVAPYNVRLSGAPSWMQINSSGQISGTAETAGDLNFNIVVEDAHERVTSLPVSVNLISGLSIKQPVLAETLTGESFIVQTQPTASGGFPPYTWELANFGSNGNPGLTIDPDSGELSGTSGAPGTYSFNIKISDTNGGTTTRAASVKVASNIAMTAPVLGDSTKGSQVVVVTQPTRTGGIAPYSWDITSGPSWLNIDSATGRISGVPTATGNFNLTVEVTDALGNSVNKSASFEVFDSLVMTPPTIGTTRLGEMANVLVQPSAAGGEGNFTWTMTGAPNWLLIDRANGTISGIVGDRADYGEITVKVSDEGGRSTTSTFSITAFKELALTAPVISSAQQGIELPIRQASVSGGFAPYAWTLDGDIPVWLSFDAETGVMSGTPDFKGTHDLTISVTDGEGTTLSNSFTIAVDPVIEMVAPTFAPVKAGQPIVVTRHASAEGGEGAKTYSMINAPNTLQIDAKRGYISGTAPQAGTYNFSVKATDKNGDSTTVSASLVVSAELEGYAPTFGKSYAGEQIVTNTHLTDAGGYGAIRWSKTSGPSWLNVSTDGLVTGVPNTNGTFSAAARVVDDLDGAVGVSFFIDVIPAMSVAAPTFGFGFEGDAIPVLSQPTGSGGEKPYKWSLDGISSALSAQINSATGEITIAEASTAGSLPLTVVLTDANGHEVSASATVVATKNLSVSAPTIAQGVIGHELSVSRQAAAVGGDGDITWSISGEPYWVSFDPATGEISGTAEETGTFNFTIAAEDARGSVASVQASVEIAEPIITSGVDISNGEVGFALPSKKLVAQNGLAPYRFEKVSGPTWLSVSTSGGLSGTPDAVGTESYTFRVTDALGDTATAGGTITSDEAVELTVASFQDNRAMITRDVRLVEQASAVGGTADKTWTMTGAPAGLTMNVSNGAITGAPTETGNFAIVIHVEDSQGRMDEGTVSLTVMDEIVVSYVPELTDVQTRGERANFNGSAAATANTGASWAMEFLDGEPNLGSIIAGNGNMAGGAWAAAGTSTFRLKATDVYGYSNYSDPVTVTVREPLTIAWNSDVQTLRQGDTLGNTTEDRPNAVGGLAPYTWTVVSDDPGYEVAEFASIGNADTANPTIVGTVPATTEAGTYSLVLRVSDSQGRVSNQSVRNFQVEERLVVTAPEIAPATSGSPFVTTALPTATGGTAPFTWEALSGMTGSMAVVQGTGQIQGTPAGIGTYTIALKVTSSEGYTGRVTFTHPVRAPLSLATEQTFDNLYAGYGMSSSGAYGAAGGNGEYTVTASDLPDGVTYDAASSQLKGTPASSGTHQFTIELHDSEGRYALVTKSIDVMDPISIATAPISPTTVYTGTNQSPFSISGGTGVQGDYQWACVTCPGNMSVSTNGTLSGYVTVAGTYDITVRAYDPTNPNMSVEATTSFIARDRLQITVAPVLADAGFEPGETITTSQAMTVTGGTGNYTYILSGHIGSGLTVDGNGALSGTANVEGKYDVSLRVQDDEGRYADTQFTLIIGAASYAYDLDPNNPQAHLLDGNMANRGSYFAASAGWVSNEGGNSYHNLVTYTFSEPIVANEFRYDYYSERTYNTATTTYFGSTTQVYVEVSEDGVNWTPVNSNSAATSSTSATHTHTATFETRTFRYARLRTEGRWHSAKQRGGAQNYFIFNKNRLGEFSFGYNGVYSSDLASP